MSSKNVPAWQLPPGVSKGTWDYLQSDSIANDYDAYFAEHGLLKLDSQVVCEELLPDSTPMQTSASIKETPLRVADLGCGSGRIVIELARRGVQCLAVDLSPAMLRVVENKANAQQLNIERLHANIVDLHEIPSQTVDHAVCLFSTLGMIQGDQYRQAAVNEAFRILKANGKYIIQVHNYWYNLYDPGGPRWLIANWWKSRILKQGQAGDRFYPYRGVSQMYLHVFRKREIKNMLHNAGFIIKRTIPLQAREIRPLKLPWLFQSLRATGWIIVCQKPND
jgi:ubiquinone/menaquinone biosynthesis C-methylase UbiE